MLGRISKVDSEVLDICTVTSFLETILDQVEVEMAKYWEQYGPEFWLDAFQLGWTLKIHGVMRTRYMSNDPSTQDSSSRNPCCLSKGSVDSISSAPTGPMLAIKS